MAWPHLGYVVDTAADRHAAAADVQRQLRSGLADSEVTKNRHTPYDDQMTTRTAIVGPNGLTGHVYSGWQYDRGATDPRMVTNWLAVDRKDDQR